MKKDTVTIVISVTRKVDGSRTTAEVVRIDASMDLTEEITPRREWERELVEELGEGALRQAKRFTTVTRTRTWATSPPEE